MEKSASLRYVPLLKSLSQESFRPSTRPNSGCQSSSSTAYIGQWALLGSCQARHANPGQG